ncbi:MAG TPA: hypothetical protein VLS85_02575 [Hanamia sp.]|nr:hypothetical protein [Hanamia sp.]
MKHYSPGTACLKIKGTWLFTIIIFLVNAPLMLCAQQISVYSPELHATLIFDPSQMTSNNARAYALVSHYALSAVNHNLQGTPDKPAEVPKEKKQARKNAGASTQPKENKKDKDPQLALINECNKKALALIDQRRRSYIRSARAKRAAAMAERAALSDHNQSHQFSSQAYDQLQQINSTGSWGSN